MLRRSGGHYIDQIIQEAMNDTGKNQSSFSTLTGTVNEFTEFIKFYKSNDALTRVNLMMPATALSSIV